MHPAYCALSARRPRPTNAERLARAAGWLAEAGRLVQAPRTKASLQGAAEGHREAALRNAVAATTEADPRTQLVLIELAGYYAIKAQLFLTKAEEAAE